jgi:hypothetical protein
MTSAPSVDAGGTWTLMPPLNLSSGMSGQRLVVDTSGRLHLVYQGAREAEAHVLGAPGMIMHSTWERGAWTRPRAVSIAPSVTAPAFGNAPEGRLLALWAETQEVPEGAMPKSLGAFWTPGCPPR